jgi:hypothetical protein
VPLKSYDESLNFLRTALDAAKVGDKDKLDGFRRLEASLARLKLGLDPEANFDAVIAHEEAISPLLGGRSVFDDKPSNVPLEFADEKIDSFALSYSDADKIGRCETFKRRTSLLISSHHSKWQYQLVSVKLHLRQSWEKDCRTSERCLLTALGCARSHRLHALSGQCLFHSTAVARSARGMKSESVAPVDFFPALNLLSLRRISSITSRRAALRHDRQREQRGRTTSYRVVPAQPERGSFLCLVQGALWTSAPLLSAARRRYDDGEELAQNVLLAVYRHAGEFPDQPSFRGGSSRLRATNCCSMAA